MLVYQEGNCIITSAMIPEISLYILYILGQTSMMLVVLQCVRIDVSLQAHAMFIPSSLASQAQPFSMPKSQGQVERHFVEQGGRF